MSARWVSCAWRCIQKRVYFGFLPPLILEWCSTAYYRVNKIDKMNDTHTFTLEFSFCIALIRLLIHSFIPYVRSFIRRMSIWSMLNGIPNLLFRLCSTIFTSAREFNARYFVKPPKRRWLKLRKCDKWKWGKLFDGLNGILCRTFIHTNTHTHIHTLI